MELELKLESELEHYVQAHVLGGLYGLALGNAWAMPALPHPDQTQAYFNDWIEELLPSPAYHPLHPDLPAGRLTNNAQQALYLAEALIKGDGILTAESAAAAVVAWYDYIDGDNVHFIGSNTRWAVSQLKADVDPCQTGLYGYTNGGIARVIPVGLIYPENPGATLEATLIASAPTHFTDVALSGACAVTAAIAQAMAPNTTLEEIIEAAIQGATLGRQHGNSWMGASVARKIEAAVELAVDDSLAEYDRLRDLYDLIGSTPAVADSVPCAFGVLAMANGNPIETAMYAAALSGDAHIVGAIAGAIAGAWYSIEAIPVEYVETLNQANPEHNLEQLAAGLTQIAWRNYQNMPEGEEPLAEIHLELENDVNDLTD
jgi:ADP-ribosylglycohydrolase